MKLTTLFLIVAISLTTVLAKPHSVAKPRSADHHSRDERVLETSTTQVKPTPKSKVDSSPSDLKRQVTEHNVHKTRDEEDGIPMESEHLIHVTQKPSKQQKVHKNGNNQKGHGRRGQTGPAKVHHKSASAGVNGKKKPHHKTNVSAHHKHPITGVKSSNIKVKPSDVHAQAGAKPKSNKPVKKYNSKKHGWKKNSRKEKAMEKQKEKRERREKKQKAKKN